MREERATQQARTNNDHPSNMHIHKCPQTHLRAKVVSASCYVNNEQATQRSDSVGAARPKTRKEGKRRREKERRQEGRRNRAGERERHTNRRRVQHESTFTCSRCGGERAAKPVRPRPARQKACAALANMAAISRRQVCAIWTLSSHGNTEWETGGGNGAKRQRGESEADLACSTHALGMGKNRARNA